MRSTHELESRQARAAAGREDLPAQRTSAQAGDRGGSDASRPGPAAGSPERAAPRHEPDPITSILDSPARLPHTLLIVEDDRIVRELMATVLASQGFQVLEAADGAAAIESVRAHDGRLDLVICDVGLPDLSGGRVVAELLGLRPEVGFLYISGNRGNFDDSLTLADADGNAIPFLPKPFAPIDLIRAVRSALDRRRLRQR